MKADINSMQAVGELPNLLLREDGYPHLPSTSLSMQIMEFFKEHEDKRYKAYQLAKILKVKSKEITATMLGLPIESAVDGKDRVYFVTSSEAKSRMVANGKPAHLVEKAKRDLRPMQIALSRCKELYPDGGNFKSVS